MEAILDLDFYFFYLINNGLSNGFFDFLLPILRNKITWIPFYIFLFWFFISKFKKIGLYIFLVAVFTVGIADYMSSSVIKKTVKRERPCNVTYPPYEVIQRIGCGGYSFTSSHAANHFALSMFLIFVLKNKYKWTKWPLFLWASMISFSQIYVGVHYPLDVLFGALLGTSIAIFTYKVMRHYFPFIVIEQNSKNLV